MFEGSDEDSTNPFLSPTTADEDALNPFLQPSVVAVTSPKQEPRPAIPNKFNRIITQCFDPFLYIYVDSQDKYVDYILYIDLIRLVFFAIINCV